MYIPKREDYRKIYELMNTALTDDTGYALTTIAGWFAPYDCLVEVNDVYALLSALADGKRRYISPLTASKEDYEEAVKAYERMGVSEIIGVNSWQAEILKARGYEVTYNPDRSEYLYAPEDLIGLAGGKYHSKRNFINRFEPKYEFRAYSPEDREGVMRLLCEWSYRHIDNGVRFCEQEGWIKYKELEKVEVDEEIIVIDKVIKDLEGFNCFADVMEIDGKIAGFAAGEVLPNGIGALYFEKGDISYRGIYPTLDNLFCAKHFSSVRYINKQEDMGLEGLRKSKQSYYPVKMAERYTAVLK